MLESSTRTQNSAADVRTRSERLRAAPAAAVLVLTATAGRSGLPDGPGTGVVTAREGRRGDGTGCAGCGGRPAGMSHFTSCFKLILKVTALMKDYWSFLYLSRIIAFLTVYNK